MQIFKATSQTITRPADTTQYASGDLVANSTTAGSVTPFALRLPKGMRAAKIWRGTVIKSAASVTTAAFRIHLYADSPTVANGDNGAWSSTASNYFDFIDVVAPGTAFSNTFNGSGIYVKNALASPLFILPDTDGYIYALLEARGTYTPASEETFSVQLVGEGYA